MDLKRVDTMGERMRNPYLYLSFRLFYSEKGFQRLMLKSFF